MGQMSPRLPAPGKPGRTPAHVKARRLDSVSDSDGRPLHLQVKHVLSAGLESGMWRFGEKLPTEVELSGQLGVSEGTVKQAVLALVKEGRLTRRSGKGTFVSRARFDRSFAHYFRFKSDESPADPSYTVSVIGGCTDSIVHPDIREALRVGRQDQVVVLHRIISADGIVICHCISHLAARRFAGLLSLPLDGIGLYDALERHYKIHVVRANETLRARIADQDDQRILNILKGEPVITIQRIAYSYQDQVVEVRNTVGRSDTFRYEIQLGQSGQPLTTRSRLERPMEM